MSPQQWDILTFYQILGNDLESRDQEVWDDEDNHDFEDTLDSFPTTSVESVEDILLKWLLTFLLSLRASHFIPDVVIII